MRRGGGGEAGAPRKWANGQARAGWVGEQLGGERGGPGGPSGPSTFPPDPCTGYVAEGLHLALSRRFVALVTENLLMVCDEQSQLCDRLETLRHVVPALGSQPG